MYFHRYVLNSKYYLPAVLAEVPVDMLANKSVGRQLPEGTV